MEVSGRFCAKSLLFYFDIEDASHDEGDRIARPSETVESRGAVAAATDEIQETKMLKQEQESRLKNRMAFFGAVAEPVRINARQFLGLDPQIASDAASTAATNDTKNSEKEDAEDTEDKGFIQGDNKNEKGELREDKKAEADISKRQLKRKTKHKTKKKKMLRAREQTNEEKMNSRSSETAIASSVHAAKRQIVAVVPLSEESSGISDSSDDEDEDSLEIKGYTRLKTVPQHQSSVEDGDDRDYVDLVSNASFDLQASGPMEEEEEEEACLSAEMRDKESEEAMPFHVLDEDDFYSETNAPRPGLLVAEAMFRSYEESTVVTTTSGSDKCFDSSSSSGNDDKAELLAPDKDDEDNQYGEDASCQRSSFSNTEVEGNNSDSFQRGSGSVDLRREESSLNESAFVDLKSIPEVINDGCVTTDLIEAQSDGVSTMTADTGSQIHENVQAEEIHATVGPSLPCVDNKCDVGRNSDTDYHCELSRDHSEKQHDASNQQSVLSKLGNKDGGQIGKIHPTVDCLETRCPPRAESESLSDDEREMSSDFLSQNTLSADKSDGIQKHRESLGKDEDSLLQSGLNVGKNVEFIDDETNTNCLDPVRRLDDLLYSLSSRNCCVSESNSPASLNTSFDDENVNSSRVLCVQPKAEHQKKFHREGKIKCKIVGDSVADEHIANEESAVDENVNYIRPTLVSLLENGADKELGSSSSNSSRCLCMDVSSEVVRNYETLGAEVSGCSPTATGYNEDVEKKQEPRSTLRDVGYTDKNCSTVSTVSLLDAKRRFFQEVAQPVRINPLTVFRSDVPSKLPDEKPCHKIPLQSSSSTEEEKQLEIDSQLTIKEDEKMNRQPLLTTPLPLDLSTNIEPHIQTDVVELGQLSNKLGTLSLSESEINCRASVVTKRSSPSSILLSPSDVLTEAGQNPLAAEKWASLPNVQLFMTVNESEKFMSHLLAENLRLDHKNLMKTWDRMKAGSSSMSEFRNSEVEMKIDEMHSTTSEIPNRIDESAELERQSTA